MMGFGLVMSHFFDDLQLIVARNVGRDEVFAIFVERVHICPLSS